MEFNEDKIRSVLLQSWSLQSATQWEVENPALGQCNVTALLVNELFGGLLLKTNLQGGSAHFYNEVGGRRYDFTDSQFMSKIKYDDVTSTIEEVQRGISIGEINALKDAFLSRVKY